MIQSNQSERAYFILLDIDGNGVTGLTGAQLNMLILLRKSDGKYYDGADWQATKTDLAVIEHPPGVPGLYYYDTPSLQEDEYIVIVNTSDAANVPQLKSIKAGSLADTLIEILQHLKNKFTIDEARSMLCLWDDSGDNIMHEWPLTDKDGNPIVLSGKGPANRGMPE